MTTFFSWESDRTTPVKTLGKTIPMPKLSPNKYGELVASHPPTVLKAVPTGNPGPP